MISISRAVVIPLKIYVAIVLLVATVLSPLVLSWVPLLLLAWYLFQWWWRVRPVIRLLTEYFTFWTAALLLAPAAGLFSLLISLPLLFLTGNALEEAATSLAYYDTARIRRPTSLYLTLLVIAVIALAVSPLVGSSHLLLASLIAIVYLVVLGIMAVKRMPAKPVAETQIRQRVVAGSRSRLHIEFTNRTKIGGRLFLKSPYQWLKLNPPFLSLKDDRLAAELTLSPPLSGPLIVKLQCYALDRWGLFQTRFEVEPVNLYVIPRARYAAWLTKKYLAGTKAGALPIISNIEALKPLYGFRRGVEYYGSKLYQPGDSLKNIDWKHSVKYSELITKEFAESHGQPAIMLINLAVSNAEEADKLVYNIIATALSLARENIPAALAVYNHEDVKLTTGTLPPGQLLLHSLQIAQEMVTIINPVKYLNAPDITRLRANISHIRLTESKASNVLAQLLQWEYQNLSDNAKLNPATKALERALAKGDKQSNVVIISNRNHDAEALTFTAFNLAVKGNAVISL